MLTIRKDQLQSMAQARPNTTLVAPCPATATWIEVVLVDQNGAPVPNVPYQITLPDGSTQQGMLDQNGSVRFDGIVPGSAQITFSEIDGKEWTAA